jgi:hypothetical protein
MADAETIERLRHYLRALSSTARGHLTGELERSVLRGDTGGGADLVLQQLRRIAREQRESGARTSDTARLFFRPVEPFVVDDRGEHKHPGRIARSSLEHLWLWIRRDLLREDAKALADEVNDALLAGDKPCAERLINAFQDRAAEAIRSRLDAIVDDEKAQLRLQAQITTPAAIEEATTLRRVLAGRNALAQMGRQLPRQIVSLAYEELAETRALIESTAAYDGELFIPALLMVMSRLTAPWQLVRLATKLNDAAARLSGNRYSITIAIVVAELERLIGELRTDLRSGRGVAVGALLKTIHDCLHGLRTELNLPIDHPWARSIAAQRTLIADLLRFEFDNLPGKVRRLLRVRRTGDIGADTTLDPDDVAETETLLEFAVICRQFADELAVNEIAKRTLAALQDYLDQSTRALVESLRHAEPAARGFRRSQLDAALRFCGKVLEPEHAAELTRLADAVETRAA